MRLDEFVMRTFGFENINIPAILISEEQVSVNGKVITLKEFPIASQDVVSLKDPLLAKKNVHYWNLRQFYNEIGLQITDDVLAFGLDHNELTFFMEKKHSATVVCLAQEVSALPEKTDTLLANPMLEELARKTKRLYNIFAFGPRFDSFRIGKILDVNKGMLVNGSKVLIKLMGTEEELQGQRMAILAFAKNLDMEEVLYRKMPYGRHFAWMMVRKL